MREKNRFTNDSSFKIWSRVICGGRMTKWKGQVASYAPNFAEFFVWSTPFLLAGGMAVGSAAAADRYWDPNGTALGRGGAGTWNTTSAEWSPNGDGVSGPYSAWNNSGLDNAIFGGATGTVTISGSVTANSLTTEVTGYIFTGGKLDFAGTVPSITVNAGTTTISSVIEGTAGLTKAGAGILALNGINTFTGDINISAGQLSAANDAALGGAGNAIFTATDAIVELVIGGTGTSRTINLGSGSTTTLAGSGVGSALFNGSGQVTVTNGVAMSNDASTYTGKTTFVGINGVGYSYFSSIGNLGEASSLGAPTTVADGTVTFKQANNYSDNVVYTGSGNTSDRGWDMRGNGANLRNRGTGTLSISGDVFVNSSSTFAAAPSGIIVNES
ncbi:autotransporter-associated beta strand repeat-containing protein [Ochrobactrum vermis]|uniref:Autotransporter-associated beta strand repeat-containing protein n=1 Tax=Ochrobactrum vermis TaxID=1827297 RepID=A0ABU8PEI4_9HYPH